jgi:dTDP-4-amino-4,6-dideoxygalactose transaminase
VHSAAIPVPLLDLAAELQPLQPELDAAYRRVFDSGQFVLGPEVDAFEREVAAALGVAHAVALNSGTDALTIALRAVGVKPGDEVITTPFSFFATSETVLLLGATPVFVDLRPGTFLIDPEAVARAITPRTRAILPVHLYGELAPMAALRSLADAHGLALIEDAAQAMGARYLTPCRACPHPEGCSSAPSQRCAGALGDVAAFSFYPTKNLGALGDGGMLTTNDANLAALAKRLRNHGSERRYEHEEAGYNSRMDALQAAWLRVKLPHLTGWNNARRQVAERYQRLFAEAAASLEPGSIETPAVTAGHVFHQYTLRLRPGVRERVAQALRERQIGSMVYYPNTLERYGGRVAGSLAEAHAAAKSVLSIPIYPTLTEAQQRTVVEAVCDAVREASQGS